MDRATIAIIDDEPSVLRSIARILDVHGYRTSTYDSAASFLDSIDDLSPNCIISDLSMPDLNGLELQQALIDRNAHFPLIFVTGRGDIRSSVEAMRLGAVDYLPKPFEKGELLDAVGRALDQDRARRDAIQALKSVSERLASLTRREREVFERVVTGLMNKQIAGELGITEKTIKVHRARVMHKMQVRSVAELARIAERLDIGAPKGG